MKGVILAAGEGTRLRPRTSEVPKPLVEVRGKPILTHCFETLIDLGVRETVVVVGYKSEKITQRYGESFRDLSIQYAYQADRDGLARAVLAAQPYVDADCIVLNGDNIYNANLASALDHHRRTDADVTFLIDEVSPSTARDGAVCELDEAGNVTGLVEKPEDPPSTCVPTAFYILPPEIFPACRLVRPSQRGEYELPDAIDLLIYSGCRVDTLPFEGWKVNINTEDDIERAERMLSERR